MSLPHHLVSARSLTQLGRTIRQVLTLKSSEETIHVHGWVKSIRVQKRIAFAMVHDGTTPKGLQVVFRNPADAKVSVPSSWVHRALTYPLQKG
jgi:aspartyl/asparaginyl-tRNA synthetase